MKTYDLYFVRGVNMYVFNTREDADENNYCYIMHFERRISND